MPDYICPNCGQKALAVATRCPRCGQAIEAQFIQAQSAAPKQGRRKLIIIVAVAVLVIVVASRFQHPPRPDPLVQLPAAVVVDSAEIRAAAATKDSAQPSRDTTTPVPGAPAASAAESSKSVANSTAAPAPQPTVPVAAPQLSSPAPAPAAPAESPLPHGAVRRFAGTWINVRSGRDNRAPVIRILHPGDTVVVDSLVRGWYRVIARGEAVGYLDRRLLDTIPSATRP